MMNDGSFWLNNIFILPKSQKHINNNYNINRRRTNNNSYNYDSSTNRNNDHFYLAIYLCIGSGCNGH